MDNRLETLFSLAGEGETFLDVGCDHGLVSEKALKSGKFKRVIITDISAKSLQKAVKLLKPYGDRVTALVADGFTGINENASVAFIAGMGGEEITKILSSGNTLPNKMVLSPQGHSDKVRVALVNLGYEIIRDFTLFSANKYYDAILAEKTGKVTKYNQLQYKYGKENLLKKPADFISKIKKDLNFKLSLLSRDLNEFTKTAVKVEIEELENILNEN